MLGGDGGGENKGRERTSPLWLCSVASDCLTVAWRAASCYTTVQAYDTCRRYCNLVTYKFFYNIKKLYSLFARASLRFTTENQISFSLLE